MVRISVDEHLAVSLYQACTERYDGGRGLPALVLGTYVSTGVDGFDADGLLLRTFVWRTVIGSVLG